MGIKLNENQELLSFLDTEKVATLALPVDEAGTLHIATMNFAHALDPLKFYFMTSDQSEKCRLLLTAGELTAACNTGTYIGTAFTVQMRGTVKLLKKDAPEYAGLLEGYYAKREDLNRNVEGPHSVLLEFTPDWARFTEFSKGWNSTMLDLT